jgi:hypothetical protein
MSDIQPPLIARRDSDLIDLEFSRSIDADGAERAREVLESLPGVYSASVDWVGARATIWPATTEITPQMLIEVLAASGFPAQLPQALAESDDEKPWSSRSTSWRLRFPKRFWPRLAAVAALTILVLPPLWVAGYGFLPVPVTPFQILRP